MGIEPIDPGHKPLIWFARIARMLNVHAFIVIFIGTIVSSIFTNVISNYISIPRSMLAPSIFIVNLVFQYPIYTFLVTIIFILIFCIDSLMENKIPPTNKQLEQKYLRKIKKTIETLVPEGLPPDKRGLSTKLDTTFALPEFHPNSPMTDHPLEKEDLKEEHLRQQSKENWYYSFDENDKVNLITLWKNLTREKPTAVIQGYPGMGKSTLLASLACYMADLRLNPWYFAFKRISSMLTMFSFLSFILAPQQEEDSGFVALSSIQPSLVPILVNLRDYAKDEHITDSLTVYLAKTLSFQMQAPVSFLQKYLKTGSCLVLFDGLDEVTTENRLRLRVQKAIRAFIDDCRATTEQSANFNRFLITSRIADYDRNAFPDQNYAYYTIAYLKQEQIEHLIVKYYHTYMRNHPQFFQHQHVLTSEFTERAKQLNDNIKKDHTMGELGKRPLLLYLLMVILVGQEDVNLPRQRIELYRIATQLLLEGQSFYRELPQISESQAILLLGNIAIEMLNNQGSNLMPHDKVMELLQQSMDKEKAEDFLALVRNRSGLFVKRTDNDFGFYHRTFQEYFAARYRLYQIDCDSDLITQFIKDGSSNKNWREPFLLAVAYQSHQGSKSDISNQIVDKLLSTVSQMSSNDRVYAVLLAAESILEAKPFTIKNELKKQVTELLIANYEEVLTQQQYEICNQFQDIVKRWLTYIIEEEKNFAFLNDAICQYASITLLALLAGYSALETFQSLTKPNTNNENPLSLLQNIPTNFPIEKDLQKLANEVCEWLLASEPPHTELYKMSLEMLRHSSLRNPGEIKFIRHFAENIDDTSIHDLCATILQKYVPDDKPETIEALQYVAQSTNYSIRDAGLTIISSMKKI